MNVLANFEKYLGITFTMSTYIHGGAITLYTLMIIHVRSYTV